MNLRTYLMIKEAYDHDQDILTDEDWDYLTDPARSYNAFNTLESVAERYKRHKKWGWMHPNEERALQRRYAPKGVVSVMDNKPTFGKKPIKALPGIGPMPAGLDYGK